MVSLTSSVSRRVSDMAPGREGCCRRLSGGGGFRVPVCSGECVSVSMCVSMSM